MKKKKAAALAAAAAAESGVPAVDLPHRVAILSFEGPDRYVDRGPWNESNAAGPRTRRYRLRRRRHLRGRPRVGGGRNARQRYAAALVAMDFRASSAQRLRRRSREDCGLGIEPAGVRRRSDRHPDQRRGRTHAGPVRGMADGRRCGCDRPLGAPARRARQLHDDVERQQHLRLGKRRLQRAAFGGGDHGREQVHEVRAGAPRRAVARDSERHR